jgi:hypothetical protein
MRTALHSNALVPHATLVPRANPLRPRQFLECWWFSNFSILCGQCWWKLLVCFKTFINCEQLCNNAVNYPSTALRSLYIIQLSVISTYRQAYWLAILTEFVWYVWFKVLFYPSIHFLSFNLFFASSEWCLEIINEYEHVFYNSTGLSNFSSHQLVVATVGLRKWRQCGE